MELAFSTALNETSLLNETGDGGYFVIRVDGLEAAAERPLDEVRDAVTAAWKRSERNKATMSNADALLERHRAGESQSTEHGGRDDSSAFAGLIVPKTTMTPVNTTAVDRMRTATQPRWPTTMLRIDMGVVSAAS